MCLLLRLMMKMRVPMRISNHNPQVCAQKQSKLKHTTRKQQCKYSEHASNTQAELSARGAVFRACGQFDPHSAENKARHHGWLRRVWLAKSRKHHACSSCAADLRTLVSIQNNGAIYPCWLQGVTLSTTHGLAIPRVV